MIIKRITSQHRRDFTADIVCEHCGDEDRLENGYDDTYYHNHVVPNLKCKACGEIASKDFTPTIPKYNEWETV